MSFELEQFTSQEAQAAIIAAMIGLISGLLAVLAALLVGIRQGQILKRQTDIAVRMVELEEIRLKTELYDRRMEVFTAVREVLSITVMTGKVPGMDTSTEGTPLFLDAFQRFQKGWSASQFLFNERSRAHIEHIHEMLAALSGVTAQVADNQSGLNSVELTNAVERRRNLRAMAEKEFNDLARHFPQLNLTVGDAHV